MNIFNIFRKSKREELKQQPPELPPINQQPNIDLSIDLLEMPEYKNKLFFLEMIKGKKLDDMFSGRAGFIPENKMEDIRLYFDECINNGLAYVTQGNESVLNSFSRNEFVKVLKENNLPISGNKIDLVERIESNVGLQSFYDTGKVSNWIKLTDIGKSKLKEYNSDFDKKFASFKQELFLLFMSNKVAEACYNAEYFKRLYPLGKVALGMKSSISFNDMVIFSINSNNKILKSNILEKIGVPEPYRRRLLCTICTNESLGVNYEKELEEIYSGFKQLLIESNLIVSKDFPFIEFRELIRGN